MVEAKIMEEIRKIKEQLSGEAAKMTDKEFFDFVREEANEVKRQMRAHSKVKI